MTEKEYEEELREREAALDDAMDARAIRGEALGQDRHFRRYWWFPGKEAPLDFSILGVLEARMEVVLQSFEWLVGEWGARAECEGGG